MLVNAMLKEHALKVIELAFHQQPRQDGCCRCSRCGVTVTSNRQQSSAPSVAAISRMRSETHSSFQQLSSRRQQSPQQGHP
jgi:hypothetical protein